jgi:hypothetical protein
MRGGLGCIGQPGSAGSCPVAYSPFIEEPTVNSVHYSIKSHPTVDAHPVTGDGIVAFYALGDDGTFRIVLDFYSVTDASRLYRYYVDTDTFTANTTCNSSYPFHRCGSGTNCGKSASFPCMRSNLEVPITTKMYNGRAYLYVGYDKPCNGTAHLFKSSMLVYDITDESALYSNRKAWWISEVCSSSNNNNQFGTAVAASKFNDGVGFFFYEQTSNNPCHTVYKGATDTNAGLTNVTLTQNFVSSFLSVNDNIATGMGDYNWAVKKGTSDGLVVAWGQSWVTHDPSNPNCKISCTFDSTTNNYTTVIYGATVVP